MTSARPIAEQRLAQGAAAVMSLDLAAQLLPVSDAEARRWLRQQGLVRDLLGRSVVVWADVLDALRAADGSTTEPAAAPRHAPMPRVKLPRRDPAR